MVVKNTVIKSKIEKGDVTDKALVKLVKRVRKVVNDEDDDYLLICAGLTGTGKSTLMLHAMEVFTGGDINLDYVALDREGFADSLSQVLNEKGESRYLCYDEANVNKRGAMTNFNKELIDLYFSIRGLNIFHWWNNPSLDMIDKPFIEDVVNGIIFIGDKSDSNRKYHFLTRKKLLDFYNDHKSNLSNAALKQDVSQYSNFTGAFNAYEGSVWEDYLEMKEGRMEYKAERFRDRWGSEDGDGDSGVVGFSDSIPALQGD